jgi:hypothetical protein
MWLSARIGPRTRSRAVAARALPGCIKSQRTVQEDFNHSGLTTSANTGDSLILTA